MDDRVVARRQAQRIHHAMRLAELSVRSVWLHYFTLGGDADEVEVDAYLHHALEMPRLQRDMLAHAVNELLLHRPVELAPYSDDIDDINGSAHRE